MSFIRDMIDPPGGPPQPRAPRASDDRDEGTTVWQALMLDTAVGIPLLFMLSAAMMGSLSNAITFFVIAVVCTAGVSLLILLPLACVLGALVRRPIAHLLNRQRSATSAA